MPNYKGHLVGGCLAYGIVLCLFIGFAPSLTTRVEWLLFALAGSLFPDVDIKSRGQKYFYYLVFIIFLILAFRGLFKVLSCFSFIVITPMLTRHRGVFHSVWFVVLIPLLICVAMGTLYPALSLPLFFNTLFFISGALSHILLDRGIRNIFRYSSRR